MKTKLHFGVLIILLAFFGRYLEQSTDANQQIVIQFSDENIAEEDAETTIDDIYVRLQSIGAEHIQIGQNENGQLKITYYSNADVQHIQDILSKEGGFKFALGFDGNGSADFPLEKAVKNYKLNISEIQNSSNINWDFEGVQIAELNQKSDRFNKVKLNVSGENINIEHSNSIILVAIKENNTVAIAINNLSYKIPEVRAGPANQGTI